MFTPKDVSRFAGVHERTLNYWSTSGLLNPTEPGAGRRPARYSFRDLVAVRTVVRLRAAGVSLQALRRVVQFIRDAQGTADNAEALAGVVLAVAGDDVYVISDGHAVSALRSPGQAVFIACDVGSVVREMTEIVRKAA